MGTIQPTHLIITAISDEKDNVIAEIKRIIKKDGSTSWYKKYVRIFDNLVNGYVVIFMSWDGSKEGRQESDEREYIFTEILNHYKETPVVCVDVCMVATPGEYHEDGKILDIARYIDE